MLTLTFTESSPFRYATSSSPGRAFNSGQGQGQNPASSSSSLFLRSTNSASHGPNKFKASRRGDIHSEHLRSSTGSSGPLFVNENGVPVRGGATDSDTQTFSQLDPNTSDAEVLGGSSTRVIWGTNVSIQDTMASFKKFLLNYTKKYRMWADGATEEETDGESESANHREYVEMLRKMRAMGITGLNLDMHNLKAFPPTLKLWHQLQSYPQEVIPLMDQLLKDVMVEEGAKEMSAQRARMQRERPGNGILSSELPMSSLGKGQAPTNGDGILPLETDLLADIESRAYKIRPFGLDKTINLRDLDPSGELGP